VLESLLLGVLVLEPEELVSGIALVSLLFMPAPPVPYPVPYEELELFLEDLVELLVLRSVLYMLPDPVLLVPALPEPPVPEDMSLFMLEPEC
jgi:hypothetical protein